MSRSLDFPSVPIDQHDRIPAGSEKCLVFQLGDGVHALALRHVLEIVPIMPFVSVPRSPSSLAGTLDLRGRMIPVVDLARLLERSESPHKPSCIVIVQTDTRVVAVLADRLVKVATVPGPDCGDASSITLLDPYALHDAVPQAAEPLDPALLTF